ncbi:ribonuclease H-like domain-containing protein [Tanacetum coccineum]
MYPTGPFQTFTTPASGSSGQKTSFTRCLLRRNNTMTYYFCLNMDTGAEAGEVALIYNNADFLTRRVLLRCDSTGNLYPVTSPSPIPHAFLVSQHTWHQRFGHPGGEVLRRLVSFNFISCNKEKPPVLCHACQLGKHVKLHFVSSDTVISSCFDIIHSDV